MPSEEDNAYGGLSTVRRRRKERQEKGDQPVRELGEDEKAELKDKRTGVIYNWSGKRSSDKARNTREEHGIFTRDEKVILEEMLVNGRLPREGSEVRVAKRLMETLHIQRNDFPLGFTKDTFQRFLRETNKPAITDIEVRRILLNNQQGGAGLPTQPAPQMPPRGEPAPRRELPGKGQMQSPALRQMKQSPSPRKPAQEPVTKGGTAPPRRTIPTAATVSVEPDFLLDEHSGPSALYALISGKEPPMEMDRHALSMYLNTLGGLTMKDARGFKLDERRLQVLRDFLGDNKVNKKDIPVVISAISQGRDPKDVLNSALVRMGRKLVLQSRSQQGNISLDSSDNIKKTYSILSDAAGRKLTIEELTICLGRPLTPVVHAFAEQAISKRGELPPHGQAAAKILDEYKRQRAELEHETEVARKKQQASAARRRERQDFERIGGESRAADRQYEEHEEIRTPIPVKEDTGQQPSARNKRMERDAIVLREQWRVRQQQKVGERRPSPAQSAGLTEREAERIAGDDEVSRKLAAANVVFTHDVIRELINSGEGGNMTQVMRALRSQRFQGLGLSVMRENLIAYLITEETARRNEDMTSRLCGLVAAAPQEIISRVYGRVTVNTALSRRERTPLGEIFRELSTLSNVLQSGNAEEQVRIPEPVPVHKMEPEAKSRGASTVEPKSILRYNWEPSHAKSTGPEPAATTEQEVAVQEQGKASKPDAGTLPKIQEAPKAEVPEVVAVNPERFSAALREALADAKRMGNWSRDRYPLADAKKKGIGSAANIGFGAFFNQLGIDTKRMTPEDMRRILQGILEDALTHRRERGKVNEEELRLVLGRRLAEHMPRRKGPQAQVRRNQRR